MKRKTKKQSPEHKCIALMNKKLRDMGVILDTEVCLDFNIGMGYLVMKLPLRRRDGYKGKMPTIVCTFCPICGERIEQKPIETKEG